MIYTQQEIDWHRGQIQHYLECWRQNPLAFVIQACQAEKFGYPVDWQASLLNRIPNTRYEAVSSGHGIGKSRIEAWAAWWVMICLKQPGKPLKIPVTGPSGSNLKDVLWSELELVRNHLHPWIAEQFIQNNEKLYQIESDASWFMKLRTARKEKPDALQGFHGDPIFYIIDEGSGVEEKIFEVARGALTGEHSYALMCGNPVRLRGYFHRAFHAARSPWHTTRVSCLDQLSTRPQQYWWTDILGKSHEVNVNGRVSQSYVDDMKDEFGERSTVYKTRVTGEFPTSEADQLIKNNWMKKAIERHHPSLLGDYPRVWGLDIAWQGEDDSALVSRYGPIIDDIETWHGNDPTESADKVYGMYVDAKRAGKAPKWICVDIVGVGGGVFSALRKKKVPVIGVHAGHVSIKDGGTECLRMRDWLWWQARLLFKDHNVCFEGNSEVFRRLQGELTTPTYKVNASKKVEVESKDELRKRGVKSPDVADALCLTMRVGYRGDMAKKQPASAKRNRHRKHSKRKKVEKWILM